MRDKPLQRGHRPQLPSITFQFIISLLGGKTRTQMYAGLFQRKMMLFHPGSSGEATRVTTYLFNPSLLLFRVKAVRQRLNRQSSGDQSDSSRKHAAKRKWGRYEKKINKFHDQYCQGYLTLVSWPMASVDGSWQPSALPYFPAKRRSTAQEITCAVFTSASASASPPLAALSKHVQSSCWHLCSTDNIETWWQSTHEN